MNKSFAFNRTIIELKHLVIFFVAFIDRTFNRTIIELKLR